MQHCEHTAPAERDDDFAAWAALARDRPGDFEQIRRETLAAVIERSGRNAPALRRLQAQLDLARIGATTPLAACTQLLSYLSQIEPQLRELAGAVESHPFVRSSPRRRV